MSAGSFTLEVDVGLPLHVPLQLMQTPTAPCDITGYSFVSGIRPRASAVPLIPIEVTVTDATTGNILLTASAEDLGGLPLSSYAWDLVVTDTTGAQSVLLRGPVTKLGVIAIS